MVDYSVGTGAAGALIIRDFGFTVQAIIKCNSSATFANGKTWSVFLGNGGSASGTFSISGAQEVVVWQGDFNATVSFQLNMGATGTSGLGGPTTLNATITRTPPPPPPTVPGAPTHVGVDQITTTSMRYRFSGTTDGGSPILEWQVRRGTDLNLTSGLVDVSSSGTTVATGLQPNQQYWFASRGRNAVGWGPYSAAPFPSGTTLPATPPGLTAVPSLAGTSVTLTMTPPAGVSSVDSYTVEQRTIGGATTGLIYASSPQTLTGRTPGQSIEYRAAANIGTYQTPFSAWLLVTQPNPNTSPGDYFDGNTAATTDSTYSWTGATNLSASQVTNPSPLNWAPFADGAINSMAGTIARVAGGLFGLYAALVRFNNDGTGAGFNARTSPNAAVAENGVYVGSIHVNPTKGTRMQAQIRWFSAALVPLGSSVGTAVVVAPNVWTRLTVQATAPAGAMLASVGWVDVAGTGFVNWLGGDRLLMDAAMVTIAELFPYFDGSFVDTNDFDYSWFAVAHNSISSRQLTPPDYTNALVDPDIPVVPNPPSPPSIIDPSLDTTGRWRRYWAIVPEDLITDWLAVIPTITITTGAVSASQVRIRIFENPLGLAPSAFPSDQLYVSEQIISYIPPNSTITLDGVSQRTWATVGASGELSADHLLYGSNGAPATWPILTCGIGYLIAFDVPLDAPDNNITTSVSFTRRY